MTPDDFKPGYPRFTALISAYEPYFILRRFDRLRARIMLLKQDKLSVLEEKLNKIDEQETSILFLGKSRSDNNPDRLGLLSEIENCLGDYDQFLHRTSRTLCYSRAKQRDKESLLNWLRGTGSIARDETAYLTYDQELVSLAPTGDDGLRQLETWIENKLIYFQLLQVKWVSYFVKG
ncbi:hypothetical protein F4774DRAFT_427187 [Daldinia eschscholtzii]|nr:hypothetical protein F4774DRAFT_427187 [Daldinia eschscholtzii]